ncbi:CCA tRNA nucleotidyltransferase [Paenibacillus shenyangensis]|uniref:CCA tRNA nucleotidyltransferase n=1 Tax=Paenibacillus sp. A9 TaxID=1284352 RepID=UPI0003828911|nr:CCA tRNA nucleotidyltransferase [Paenibacillus sp. A9]
MDWKWIDPQMAEQGISLLRRLIEQGYEGYFVGGCVRDELMGRPVNDMDIATNATPEQVMNIFEHTIPTGIAHGTITVIMNGEQFEVTTYRTESDYTDHRRPEQVQFVSDLYEDLRRRDFTMNAIARGIDGSYVDPFHGQEDLEQGIIRCVGDPEERFEEDALRMLRGIRFSSVFDFTIEPATWQALVHRRSLIRYIAAERIRVEMEKMIAGLYPFKGIRLLQESELVPDMKINVPCPPEQPELLMRLADIPADPAVLRWTLIVMAMGLDSERMKPYMKEWTFSNAFMDQVSRLLRMNERLLTAAGTDAEESLFEVYISAVVHYGRETALQWQQLYPVLMDNEQQQLAIFAEHGKQWLDEMNIFSLGDVEINGQELLAALQAKGGPWLGKLMNEILLATAAGQLDNTREAILDYARQQYEKRDN